MVKKKMRLSDREKKLLYILALVLVISICGKFLAIPALDRINGSKRAIEQSGEERYEVISTSEKAKDIEDSLNMEINRAVKQTYFYYDIDEVYADKLLQEYAKNFDIEITKLSFLEADEENISGYSNGIIDMIMKIIMQRTKIYEEGKSVSSEDLEYFASNSSQIQESPEEESTESISPVISCHIDVIGQLDNIVKMVDRINSSGKSIHVSYIDGDVILEEFTGRITVDVYYFK
jgi:hypothetical protein